MTNTMEDTERAISIMRFNRAARKAIRRCGTFSFIYGGMPFHIEEGSRRGEYRCWDDSNGKVSSIADTPHNAWSNL